MPCSTTLWVTSVLLGLLVSWGIFYWRKFRENHYWKARNVPCETPMPIFGNIGPFFSGFSGKVFFEYELYWYETFGRIFGAYTGSTPMLFISEPDLLRKILVKDFHIFADRRDFKSPDKITNCFITALTGDDWKRVRSVITPAFTTGRLKKMIALMKDCAKMTVNHFTAAAEAQEPVECKRIFGGHTMDIIASAAFGTKLDSVKDPDNIFIQHAKQIFSVDFQWRLIIFMFLPKVAKFFKIQPFRKDVISFFHDLTNEIVEKRKKTNETRGDFLQLMIDAQKNSKDGQLKIENENEDELKDLEVHDVDDEEGYSLLNQYTKNKTITVDEFVAQCILFFLAGYDTTATTLSLFAYRMALNPACQQKLIQEVDQIWKKYPNLGPEALSELKYMDAAISETLRMSPPGTRLERKAMQDYPLGDTGITIPKGMIVAIPVFAMHYDPEFYPDPQQFNPDRFLPENKDDIRPYTYLPFGSGPRNCLGMRFSLMEIKLCLLHLFKEVTFERCKETKVPLELYKGAGLYSPKAVTLKVAKRQH